MTKLLKKGQKANRIDITVSTAVIFALVVFLSISVIKKILIFI